jgi:hypothetical protein
VQKPSDLGFSDEGYELPPLDVRWHEIRATTRPPAPRRMARRGCSAMPRSAWSMPAREKRDSLPARIAKLMELRAEDPDAHRLIWHDLEAERLAIEKAIPGIGTVYGAQDDRPGEPHPGLPQRQPARAGGQAGDAGLGLNFQRFCWWAVFLGIGFKFNDFIQAIYRMQRFGQTFGWSPRHGAGRHHLHRGRARRARPPRAALEAARTRRCRS